MLRECIGEGAFAAVYRSDQPLLGREAVVKVLHQRMRESEVMLQRFLREARLASRLDHPYAAHVYAFGVEPDDGLAWIAMELVHGTSLERWLAERGPMPLDVLVGLIEQVAEIVQNAHDHGIVHRDLKPSNVMLIEYAGKIFPKLLDFGIAKLVDETAQGGLLGAPVEAGENLLAPTMESGNLNLTQANATLGSPPYMSPEQWCDPLSVGPRSDLYSLAVMTYEALTGRQPFTGDTIAAIGEQHCNAEVPTLGDRFPTGLDRVFQRGLAKAPADRPVSAIAFARELRYAAFPRSAAPESTIALEATVPNRKRRMWPLAAVAAVLVAGGIAVYAFAAGDRDGIAATLPSPAPVEPASAPGPSPVPAAAEPTVPVATDPVPGAPPASATVHVEIASMPQGAEVYRIPSETRVGYTPYRVELTREDGTQVFLIRKPGFADRRVEVDLRTGGTLSVKLLRSLRKPAPPPAGRAPARREGEPVDPFRPKGA
ncbi:MAG TPA: protein kinase [Kofleriaceae bacterium]